MGDKPKVIVKQGAPGWMVSFSDLNTLLLTFFILLIVFAQEKKAGLEDVGKGKANSRLDNGLGGPYHGSLSLRICKHVRPNYMARERLPAKDPLPSSNAERYMGDGTRFTPHQGEAGVPNHFSRVFQPETEELTRRAQAELVRWIRTLARAGSNYHLHLHCTATDRDHNPHDLAGRRVVEACRFLIKNGVPACCVNGTGSVVQSENDPSGTDASLSMNITVTR